MNNQHIQGDLNFPLFEQSDVRGVSNSMVLVSSISFFKGLKSFATLQKALKNVMASSGSFFKNLEEFATLPKAL